MTYVPLFSAACSFTCLCRWKWWLYPSSVNSKELESTNDSQTSIDASQDSSDASQNSSNPTQRCKVGWKWMACFLGFNPLAAITSCPNYEIIQSLCSMSHHPPSFICHQTIDCIKSQENTCLIGSAYFTTIPKDELIRLLNWLHPNFELLIANYRCIKSYELTSWILSNSSIITIQLLGLRGWLILSFHICWDMSTKYRQSFRKIQTKLHTIYNLTNGQIEKQYILWILMSWSAWC